MSCVGEFRCDLALEFAVCLAADCPTSRPCSPQKSQVPPNRSTKMGAIRLEPASRDGFTSLREHTRQKSPLGNGRLTLLQGTLPMP